MKIFKSGIIFLCSILIISSCDKNDVDLIAENNKWEYLDSANSANIKVIDVYAGNTPLLPTATHPLTGPQIFIYANGAKLNGTPLGYIHGTTYASAASTSPSALGLPFPITNVYANIPSGSTRFDFVNARMNLTVVPNVPAPGRGDTLTTFTTVLDKGKYYSLYFGDTLPNFRVTMREDDLTPPDSLTFKIRLANFIMNPTDVLSLYSRRQQAEIITGVSHKNVSNWVQLPLPIISDTLEIRQTGSTTTYLTVAVASNFAPGFLPTAQRMYTVLARGRTGVPGKAPSASLIINR